MSRLKSWYAITCYRPVKVIINITFSILQCYPGLWWSLCISWMSSSGAKHPTERSSSRRTSVFVTSMDIFFWLVCVKRGRSLIWTSQVHTVWVFVVLHAIPVHLAVYNRWSTFSWFRVQIQFRHLYWIQTDHLSLDTIICGRRDELEKYLTSLLIHSLLQLKQIIIKISCQIFFLSILELFRWLMFSVNLDLIGYNHLSSVIYIIVNLN